MDTKYTIMQEKRPNSEKFKRWKVFGDGGSYSGVHTSN